MHGLFTIAFVAVLACWIQGFAWYKLLHHFRIIDNPNARSSHSSPTVRGGGIAIILTTLIGTLWLSARSEPGITFVLAACTMALAILSFIDDLRSLPAAVRFACHVFAAAFMLVVLRIGGIALAASPGFASTLLQMAIWVPALLWVIGYTNAFNFMDGINGIAAGQAAITGLGMAFVVGVGAEDFSSPPVLLFWVLAGAALGFLPHNFPKARMFMGDVGSAPLGFMLSVSALWAAKTAGSWLIIPLAMLHANFVLDTGMTLLRRVVRGDRWYEPHREHFYQRLVRAGKSHTFVTCWELALQLLVLVLMLIYVRSGTAARIALASLVPLIWMAFFAYCEIAFRNSIRGPAAAVPARHQLQQIS